MAASAWLVHNTAKLYIAEPGSTATSRINLEDDDFKVALFLSTSPLNTARADVVGYLDAVNTSHEHANQGGAGYLTGGLTVASTADLAAGVVTFDTADAAWTAEGSSIIARYAAIYDNTVVTPTADPIICSCILDTTGGGEGQNVEATVGNSFTVAMHADGVFTLT